MNTVNWDVTLHNMVDGSQTIQHYIPVDCKLNVTRYQSMQESNESVILASLLIYSCLHV